MNNYQICVSGAAEGKSVTDGKKLAFDAGAAIAKSGATLLTGATIGLPHYAAQGAKKAGGMSVGVSPAASRLDHEHRYHLPTDAYDFILFSGLHYVGRDALLVSSSDAVIVIGGRFGTLHEFAIAMEMNMPIGLLWGAGGISSEVNHLLRAAGKRRASNLIFGTSPSQVVKDVIKHLDQRGHKQKNTNKK